MAPKPLEVLKKGLAKFTETIKTRKKELSAKLARAETISSSDEHWLDNEGNTVDEQHVLDTLESASDYERGIERLDENGKAIVKKLREWAGDLAKVTGNKRKRTSFHVQQTYMTDISWKGSTYEKEPKAPIKKSDKPAPAIIQSTLCIC